MSNTVCGPITEIEPGEFWCKGCKAYANNPAKLIHDGRDQRQPKEDDLGWSDVEKLTSLTTKSVSEQIDQLVARRIHFTIEWDGLEWEVRGRRGQNDPQSSRGRATLSETLQAVLDDFAAHCEICDGRARTPEKIRHTKALCFK